ncbi:MAG: murein DD-endopeptidase MepM/ murein hydrolase activator NlpD [Cellvibrionaceae bacterium]|jgi:murein DD-endopeptidase MepM/ murein hydrolase activator NlpD
MKIIVFSKDSSKVHYLSVSRWSRAFLSICFLGLPLGIGTYLGHKAATVNNDPASELLTIEAAKKWSEQLAQQKEQVNETKSEANAQLNAITLRVSELQARLVRLDALGERLTTMAKLDDGEFDFNWLPGIGGPESVILGETYKLPTFMETVDQLAEQIEDREQQLDTLDDLLAKRELQDAVFVTGRPVKKGWMSSRYGPRTDPFSGKPSWHSGVDFAGKSGSEIIAVAAGVVVESGVRSGYGEIVEINHGSGLKTRYAHNKQNIANVGDVVKKGQVIALMGETGRSTGPHVHFEVYKHGRAVDPTSYIHRTRR